ncbi:MAG: adenylosuccinate lyase [Candidatus Stahlbacteria bacterium]|nr:adenylosuccinate lyase [Candidatus Stahlbacteria bacterium]
MIERYTTDELQKIWSDEYKFNCWWRVELAVIEVRSELGEIPANIVEEIKRKAKFSLSRIKEIEAKTHHDVIAFLETLEESVGEHSRWIHLGLTSYDIVDTALALQMKEAGEIILNELEGLQLVLKQRALEEKSTLTVGRTHGVHAEPTSLGLKFLLWYEEMKRNEERLLAAITNISYGKISGACGNYAHISPRIEELVCKRLGLEYAKVSTQILQRDRHAQYLFTLALISTSCEKIAQEVRHLQRTEIQEIAEPFLSGQKGSSAMPHKKNPIICEQICGLARVVRGYAEAGLQNIPLWGERDISNSAPERIIIPDATTLTHYILRKLKGVLQGLHISREAMQHNLDATRGLVFSGRVLNELIKKGLARKEAYQIVQSSSFQAESESKHLKDILVNNAKMNKLFTHEEITEFFNPKYYLTHIDSVYKRVL